MSMLDALAGKGAPAPMMPENRALRAAREAVDAHRVWDLDPAQIDTDARLRDRLEGDDVTDLRESLEQNGQAVPILVRRDPRHPDRYHLVYGARRLEAVRQSDKIAKIRALVAAMDETDATRAQISENMARRDLSFIEKALFARELVDTGFGSQVQVAEVLTVTKSSVSMALSILDMVGADLVRAIGPAHGIGRPRWEALGKALSEAAIDPETLISVAQRARARAEAAPALGTVPADPDASVAAFEAVLAALPAPHQPPRTAPRRPSRPRQVPISGDQQIALRRTKSGLRLDFQDSAFTDWLETEAAEVFRDLYARWQARS